jgi:hypothetical protein
MTSIPAHRIIAAALLATLLLPAFALAQRDGSLLGDLQTAIERNEELLGRAIALVHETNSTKARTSLEAAMKLHQLSKHLAEGDDLQAAARATMRARQAILNTINIAKREARAEEEALKAMERARIRLQQAARMFEDAGRPDDSPARKLVEEARNQLARAHNNLQEHLFDVAIQLANASAELSARAVRMLTRDDIGPEYVLREIERTDDILARLRGIDQSIEPGAERALTEAVELQNRARQNARNDKYRIALEQTRRARGIALRVAGRDGGGEATPERVERALAFTDQLLEQAYAAARENQLERAIDRLDGAAQVQRQAKDRYADAQYRSALTLTRRARDAARTTLGGMQKPLDADQVAGALAATDEALERARAAVGKSDNETARSLLERASARQRAARAALDAGDLRRALTLTRVARNLVRRALTELGNES